jgi:hypothetical protein
LSHCGQEGSENFGQLNENENVGKVSQAGQDGSDNSGNLSHAGHEKLNEIFGSVIDGRDIFGKENLGSVILGKDMF